MEIDLIKEFLYKKVVIYVQEDKPWQYSLVPWLLMVPNEMSEDEIKFAWIEAGKYCEKLANKKLQFDIATEIKRFFPEGSEVKQVRLINI